jgi:hypothetical protein
MALPIGSWLLWTTALLLLGGFLRAPERGRRLLGAALGLTLGLHLLAEFWPPLAWAAFASLAIATIVLAHGRLTSLTLAATLATSAVMVFAWPGSVAAGLDPVGTAGLGVGLMAALTSPGPAAPLAAFLGALLGHLTLGHSFDGAGTFSPDAEQLFQVAAAACAVSAALAALLARVWSVRGRLAR